MKKRPKDVRAAELKNKLAVKEAYIARLLEKIETLKETIQKLEQEPPTPTEEPEIQSEPSQEIL